MNIEEERKAFEKWYGREFDLIGGSLTRRPNGEYQYLTAHYSWKSWLARAKADGGASKEAIEDELILACLGTLGGYSSPKEALLDLINWHVDVATDPRCNGGYVLVPIEQVGEGGLC